MKKIARLNIRLSSEQRRKAHEIYINSGYEGTETAFHRDIVLGNIVHPFHKHFDDDTSSLEEREPSRKVTGAAEHRHHYQAVVIAMAMLRIKLDPDNHKYIAAQPEMFQSLVDEIRGYKFDDKTELKMPLNPITRE